MNALPRVIRESEQPNEQRAQEIISMLYSLHYRALVHHASFFLDNKSDAEDAVMTTLFTIYRNLLSCGVPEREIHLGYLIKSVKNSAINMLRKKSRNHVSLNESDQAENTPVNLIGRPDQITEATQIAEKVRAMIETLPDGYRETVKLRELDELTYPEIAEVTKRPIGTVMSRLNRGRAQLKALLEPIAHTYFDQLAMGEKA